jgi:hypothetical protein
MATCSIRAGVLASVQIRFLASAMSWAMAV